MSQRVNTCRSEWTDGDAGRLIELPITPCKTGRCHWFIITPHFETKKCRQPFQPLTKVLLPTAQRTESAQKRQKMADQMHNLSRDSCWRRVLRVLKGISFVRIRECLRARPNKRCVQRRQDGIRHQSDMTSCKLYAHVLTQWWVRRRYPSARLRMCHEMCTARDHTANLCCRSVNK